MTEGVSITATMGELRGFIASIIKVEPEKIAAFTIAIGITGENDAKVIPFMADEHVVDVGLTVCLLARAIDTVVNI
jgi:hypothetical protein